MLEKDNRTASHLSGIYTTRSFNRLTATSSASYSYNNGSMTGKTVGSTNWTYGWDRENRMASASDGTNSASYVYDALGRRVKRTQSTDVQKYTHDGDDIVLDDINATLTKYQNGLGIDDKLKQVSGGTSKYFLTDHLGSTKILANSSGASVDSNSFDSFGNATNGSFSSRYQFTGRELDGLTGMQFSRARFYDSNIGRFISEDPIGFKGGDVNLYGYVRNSPIIFKDPEGTDILGIGVTAGGFLGGGEGSGGAVSNVVGYSTKDYDLGLTGSYGGFTPYCKNGWALGGAAGASWSGFYSNAQKWDDFAGGFDTHQIGLGPFGGINLDFGTATDGRNIWVVHYSPPVVGGIGGSLGYANFNTYTPPNGVFTMNKLGSALGSEIENLYGSKGCNCP